MHWNIDLNVVGCCSTSYCNYNCCNYLSSFSHPQVSIDLKVDSSTSI